MRRRGRGAAPRPPAACRRARSVGSAQRARPGDGGEVAEAHLELHGPGGHRRRPQARRHAVGQADQAVVERGVVVEVDREGLLVADRLHLLVGDDRPLVAVPRQLVEVVPAARPSVGTSGLLGERGELPHRGDPEGGELALGGRTHAPEPSAPRAGGGGRARCRARRRGGRRASQRSLANLASSFVVATPDRRGEPGLGLHLAADRRPRSRARCRAAAAPPRRRGTPRRARSARPGA